jgi:phospholipid/cholesterol/gamma-HCH transport system substrate-binding protein
MTSDVPYRIRVLAGMTALVAILGVVTVILAISNGALSTGYALHAVFVRAGQGLYPGNDVKVRGVTVGAVQGFHLNTDDQVVVTMHIDAGTRTPASASVSIEPLSVFGPTYVDVTPGAGERSGPFLGSGATITRTVGATGLLDVLNRTSTLLNAVDTTDLTTVIDTLGEGLDGTGADIGQTIDSTSVISAHAVADLPELHALISQLASLTATLGPRGGEIDAISSNLDQVLPEISGHPDEISALLDDTSQLADDVSSLLEGHQPAIDQVVDGLTTAVSSLYPYRAGLPPLVQTLNEFFSFVGSIIRTPGEPIGGGLLAGNIQGFLPVDPCQLLTGPCKG